MSRYKLIMISIIFLTATIIGCSKENNGNKGTDVPPQPTQKDVIKEAAEQDFKEIEKAVEKDRQLMLSLGTLNEVDYITAKRLAEVFESSCRLTVDSRLHTKQSGSKHLELKVNNFSNKTVVAYKDITLFFNDFKEYVSKETSISQQIKIKPTEMSIAEVDVYNTGPRFFTIIYKVKYDDETVCELGKTEGQVAPDIAYNNGIAEKGVEYLEAKNYKTALIYFEKYSTLISPENHFDVGEAYLAKAMTYEGMEEYEESIKYYRKYIDNINNLPNTDNEVFIALIKKYENNIEIMKKILQSKKMKTLNNNKKSL